MISRLDFIGIASRDVKQSRSCDVDTLGMRPEEHAPFGAWVGETCFAIGEPERLGLAFVPSTSYPALDRSFRYLLSCSQLARSASFGLDVDDVAAARADLKAKGVVFDGETFDSWVGQMAVFSGPDGNTLTLHNRYAPYD